MLREQSKNFYVPNIYYFDTSTCKSLVGLLYHKYMLWSKSVVDLHILQIILLFKWRVKGSRCPRAGVNWVNSKILVIIKPYT